MQRLTIDWKVPLAQVEQLVEQHLQQGATDEVYSDTYTWQGRSVYLSLEIDPADEASEESSAEATLDIDCYVMLDAHGQELCKTTFELWLLKAGSDRAGDALNESTIMGYMRGRHGCGVEGFVNYDTASSWQQVERALREQQAVHAGGCLHIRAAVKKLQ
jgi:hypothetical protein